MFFGILCKDDKMAVNMLPAFIMPMKLFGGLFINIDHVPVYIRWFQYLCPLRHGFLILFQDQMETDKFSMFSAMNLPAEYGLGGDKLLSWIILLGWLVGYIFLSITILFIRKKTI